jgi:hypothetical protein
MFGSVPRSTIVYVTISEPWSDMVKQIDITGIDNLPLLLTKLSNKLGMKVNSVFISNGYSYGEITTNEHVKALCTDDWVFVKADTQ